MDSRELENYVAQFRFEPGTDPERLGWSAFCHAKAARFISGHRVIRDAKDPNMWRVEGDSAVYVVRYDKRFEETGLIGFLVCTCPWRTHNTGLIAYCSHALAVLIQAANEREKASA